MITFDPAKRQRTLQERGLDFADARHVFAGRHLTVEDTRVDYGERRLQTIGFLADLMVMVVWTPRGNNAHVFSMRRCNDRERKKFQQRLGQGQGAADHSEGI